MVKACCIQHVHPIAISGKPNAVFTIGKNLVDVIGSKPFGLTVIFYSKVFINFYFSCPTECSKPYGFILSRNVKHTSVA